MENNSSSVAHVVVNNLGGIASLIQNLILYRGSEAPDQELIVIDPKGNPAPPAMFDNSLKEMAYYFQIDPKDNWYHVFGNLAKKLSEKQGVLISNDQYDLIMLSAFNVPRKVIQLVHDAYNLSLSLKFHMCIDVFVAHSRYIYEMLLQKLPERKDDIIHIPYGIPLPQYTKRPLNAEKPLKLLYLGRHDKAKGVFDLFQINELLKQKNIPVSWVILGKGPETIALKEEWKNETNVQFLTPASHAEIMEKAADCDIFVFPTKFEGFPVALLEAMSAGCVPVVTDLPGGIKELIEDGINGYKCPIDQNEYFAEKISLFHFDRQHMQDLQNNGSQKVFEEYNAAIQSPKYQSVFSKILDQTFVPRHHNVNLKIGSRLDQKWIPNIITKLIRTF